MKFASDTQTAQRLEMHLMVALVQMAILAHHEQGGHHPRHNGKITARKLNLWADSAQQIEQNASLPSNASPSLWLVIIKYLDDCWHCFIKIHVDFNKSTVHSQSKYEEHCVTDLSI
jgi:hypothetical protein